MNKLLSENVAVITGANRGIGYAAVKKFIEHGSQVYALIRNEQNMTALSESIISDSLHTVLCDVSDIQQVKKAFQDVYRVARRIDTVINNAGVLEPGLIGMVTLPQIETTYRTNVFGAMFCCQYAARLMMRGGKGSIINISSIMGTNGAAGLSVYAGSKAAIIGITKSLAKELAEHNIRVNAVAPGFIDTGMAHAISQDVYDKRIESIGMKRIGTPEEVADMLVFLASNMAQYVTGQVIGVDGGMLL